MDRPRRNLGAALALAGSAAMALGFYMGLTDGTAPVAAAAVGVGLVVACSGAYTLGMGLREPE